MTLALPRPTQAFAPDPSRNSFSLSPNLRPAVPISEWGYALPCINLWVGVGRGGSSAVHAGITKKKKKKKGSFRPLESECYHLVTGVGKKKDLTERMQTKRTPDLSCFHTALQLAFHRKEPRKELRGGQKKPAAVIAFLKKDIGKSHEFYFINDLII